MELIKAKKLSQWRKIRNLYKSAFPEYERKPLLLVWLAQKKGNADIWIIESNNDFVGLAITMNSQDLVLLDYFAIDEKKRGNGLGSKALKKLQSYYNGRRFFLEIETVYTSAENLAERKRRKKFYLSNGMSELKIMAKVFKTDMELLGYNCSLDFDEYRSIYLSSYGKWAAENITPLDYPSE